MKVPLAQGQFDALVDFTYNAGIWPANEIPFDMSPVVADAEKASVSGWHFVLMRAIARLWSEVRREGRRG
jgi:hypothetical protein